MTNSIKLNHINQLDGFRFFAIFAVLISHFLTTDFLLRFPFKYGVFFFFVLSSFLITRILLAEKNNNFNFKTKLFSFKQFYIRRSLRIFPIYYLTILFFYALNFTPCREIFPWLASYTTNLFISYNNNPNAAGTYAHLWSLAVEEQFYFIFPFIIFLIKDKFLLPTFCIITLIGVVGRTYFFYTYPENTNLLNMHSISALDSLGIGSILAYFSIFKVDLLKKIIKNKFLFLTSGLSFLFVMLFFYTLQTSSQKINFSSIVLMRFLFNIFSFWVLGWAFLFEFKGLLKTILENKIVVYLGKISYGIYLYHFFVMNVCNFIFKRYTINFSIELKAIIFTIITIIISSLSWYIIEKPINKLKNKFNYIKSNS